MLNGLLATLRALLEGQPAAAKARAALPAPGGCNLAEEVFDRCLFALPVDAPAAPAQAQPPPRSVLGGRLPKCKMSASRVAAFDLLTTLATGCPAVAARLCAMFLPHHDATAAEEAAAAAHKSAAAAAAAAGTQQLLGLGTKAGGGVVAAGGKPQLDKVDPSLWMAPGGR